MSDTSTSDSANKVTFELASPEALLISTTADMVVVPGAEGDFGVLPGHAPFISEVRPGVIDVYQGDKIEERVFVASGFAEVNEQGCTVLSNEAYPVEDLDRGDVQERLDAAQADLTDADNDQERDAAETEITLCTAMLEAIG
ncbi:MAG: F0F1 ATP synthase subunit epsilon [Alphaproteobacteria bacterium]|jgi:F-type H+-transporting ATPase subunit epsilon